MNATELLKVMNRDPFHPFEVHLSDGARITVEHPWQISTAPNSATCTVYEGDDGMRIVAYRNITEIVTTSPV